MNLGVVAPVTVILSEREALILEVGDGLEWERLEHRRACRIKLERPANVFEREQWPEMIAFMVDAMIKLEGALKPRIQRIASKLG